MNEFVQTVVPPLSEALKAALSLAVTVLLAYASSYVKSKLASAKYRDGIDRLTEIVLTTVKATNQTVVDALKAAAQDGKIDASEAAKIKAAAVDRILAAIPDLRAFASTIGFDENGLRRFIEDKLEAVVHDLKKKLESTPDVKVETTASMTVDAEQLAKVTSSASAPTSPG